ncbi:MAG: SIMPL domain-containing protein [Betaproteobacteria bacterium]
MPPQSKALPAFIMAVAAWSCMAQAQPSAMAGATAPTNVLSLSASASVEVTMDTLSVTLAATREGPDAGVVQSQLRQALDAALAEARKAARPKALEVQTGAFSLNPRYASPSARSSQPSISGWVGRAELLIEGRDLPAVAQLVGRLATVSVARVAFGLSPEAREQLEQETTRQAITRFRTHADSYARQFGFSGYQIREVQVGLQEPPVMLARAPMLRAASMAEAQEPLPVEAGKTTVSSTVSGSVQMLR